MVLAVSGLLQGYPPTDEFSIGVTMPIATPEIYSEMIDRAKAGGFAFPSP